eukprot:CAMPEP_0113672880 /NCGR_PEP_ID=MMETSP0038_2-20120614/6530_1 /TAXON_ID=2898 /ORGANISM="Cryptomonas paramecium" /LENGTH=161 /DNA_ID=CAMNT_0000589241 /DNA_START=724 /DNA_END=1207 /DNA_ORIENTATION=+ /assembly_acc=CAM_ASM_000170
MTGLVEQRGTAQHSVAPLALACLADHFLSTFRRRREHARQLDTPPASTLSRPSASPACCPPPRPRTWNPTSSNSSSNRAATPTSLTRPCSRAGAVIDPAALPPGQALRAAHGQREPPAAQQQRNNSSKQARWLNLLAEFQFTAVHIPGRTNPADFLSRQSF